MHPIGCCSQVFLTRTHLVLAMEYAAGGDLFRYVSARRGLPEDEARWFFQQLIVAVDYCHRMVRLPRRAWRLALRVRGCTSCFQAVAMPAAPWPSWVCFGSSDRLIFVLGHPFANVQGVTSRDIKLENTLLDGGQWPLIKVSSAWAAADAVGPLPC